MSTDLTLQHLQDQLAVRDLLNCYSDAISRRNYKAWGDCWTEDAVWELGAPINGRHVGRHAIVQEASTVVESLELFVQTVHNLVVELAGDTGRTRATYHEIARAAAGGAAPFPAITDYALYEDEIQRCDDMKWRFSRRTYRVVYFDTERPSGQSWPAPFTASAF